jgi:uncharacterized protein
MRIAISGGTGFIGQALTKGFLAKGYEVFIISRAKKESAHANIHFLTWDDESLFHTLDGLDAFINLAGESLNSGRWTKERKKRIITSRITTTNKVHTLLCKLKNKPSIFINASAIGYYGTSEKETFTETTKEYGNDFLAETVVVWEKEAKKVEELGIRTVYARFGVVLGNEGGAFPKMLLPYKFGIGGNVGSGKQWLSWIHIDDVVGLLQYAINTQEIIGPLNITAPNPVTNEEFGKTIASVANKPHWLPVPKIALKVLLGEMSDLLLKGQRVIPKKAIENGYVFKYSSITNAISNLLNEEKKDEANNNVN